jgi:propanediol dehydratase small subunit
LQSNDEAAGDSPAYPLADAAGEIRAASGRRADEITLDAASELSPDDLRIRGETLRQQAAIAAQAGYPQLAANLERAAELASVPDAELLAMYNTLRPGRSTAAELERLAARLETEYNSRATAALVREAAEAYAARELLRVEG